MPPCDIITLTGPVPYPAAQAAMTELAARRGWGECPDTLLLLQHPPTITLGRRTDEADLRTPEAALLERGIAVERVDRGGEITAHGPGQAVGYPILDLRGHGQDLHRYLRDLEQVVIDTVADYGLIGGRVPGLTGVWVEGRKIAAIGIKVSRWVSTHGWALNVSNDLTVFRQDIVPCGITDRDVTSLAECLGAGCPPLTDVQTRLARNFARIFSVNPVYRTELGILAL